MPSQAHFNRMTKHSCFKKCGSQQKKQDFFEDVYSGMRNLLRNSIEKMVGENLQI